MIPFGERIRALRNERNWSQVQLAAKLGISDSQVAHYETEDRLPSLQVLVNASRIFGVSTDYLLGLNEEKSFRLDVSDLLPEEIETVSRVVDGYRKWHKKN